MPEKIFTIPINEAFDRYEGCPLCRLRTALEETTLSYVLGPAMMEPDVRIKMNETGFCREHSAALRQMKNKLPLALVMQSHLASVDELYSVPLSRKKKLFSSSVDSDGGDGLRELSESCFVCSRVRDTERRYYSNVAYLWDSDEAFRAKLRKQPYFCVTHSAGVLRAAKHELSADKYETLYAALCELERARLDEIRAGIDEFVLSFDHRNADIPLSERARSAIDDAMAFLK